METTKIVANIKASVLHESGVKGPHVGGRQLHMHHLMSLVLLVVTALLICSV